MPRVNRLLRLHRPLNRGSFFHAIYRAEQFIGKAIIGTYPYRIFPPRQYFAGFTISATAFAKSRVRSR